MNDHLSNRTLGIFAKYWEAGKVKTRLGASVGIEVSAEIHRYFVNHLASTLGGISAKRVIAISPFEKRTEFATECFGSNDWDLIPQGDQDLGNRMLRYFEEMFENGSDRVILIGSDLPTISLELIESAFVALERNDVVLGPALDGGYYLIGMSKRPHDIFQGIAWSTDSVLDETIKILKQNQLSFHLLAEMDDVDQFENLNQLVVDLRKLGAEKSEDNHNLLEFLQPIVDRFQK